jgi:diguanylate cyclase (GGDEF)-like protein
LTRAIACPACGKVNAVLVCASCGAELAAELSTHTRDCVEAGDDQTASAGDETASDQDQMWSDHDQTASDRDQNASDQDQTWSDHDQTASDRDQRSADDDQHAADDDFAAGGDASVYHRSIRARQRSAEDRHLVSGLRDETGGVRLETAEARDRAAELRDRGAEGRDELARLHDLEDDTGATLDDLLVRAQRDRYRAAADRAKAADDRRRAAGDREQAARERAEARRSQAEAASALTLASTDELTGTWTRRSGLAAVSRELERAHRTGAKLVLAFVDVDGLKAVNDIHGHVAGDALLRLVSNSIRANVRPYDVLVRYGGDELLCAMPNLTAADARGRFEKIAADLRSVNTDHSVTFGLAEAESTDSLEELIARADEALLESRRASQS